MVVGGKETYFAVSAPGLEGLVAEELRRLGLNPKEPTREAHEGEEGGGGVAFEGGLDALYQANLHLRTASRVIVRLGDFYAAEFSELRKKASRLAWERYLKPGQPVMLHVTCHKSKLYHSDAVAERVLGAIGDHLGKPSRLVKGEEAALKPVAGSAAAKPAAFMPGAGSAAKPAASNSAASKPAVPAQLIIVRLLHDHCTISVDTSGALLHRRGYRLETAKAPLRETLAAAMLMVSGWDGAAPLVDPFCGSGTIPIEAALMARRIPPGSIPPGKNRSFAFMGWPGYDAHRWTALLEALPAPAACPPILASDRDTGAIRIAQANAERAGIEDCIGFGNFAMSAIEPPPGPGWVVTNPPYGVRVSANKDLRNLYAQLGNVLRARCPGWQVAILCNDLKLLGQVGIALDTSLTFVNGGLRVYVARGRVE